jgi:D-sedoheptulose 7-phosphate isomerase
VNQVEKVFDQNPTPAEFARGYLGHVAGILGKMNAQDIARFIQTLIDARERNARIFFIGNGGSAATASHFANDIAIGCRSWERPFRASSLTDNMPIFSAIANDYGYEHVFTLQLKTMMERGDVVVAISASGNSPNVVRALQYANENGAITVSLTGFDGGELKRIAQVNVHVPSDKGEYGPVEDVHMVLDHLVGAFLMHLCRTETVART